MKDAHLTNSLINTSPEQSDYSHSKSSDRIPSDCYDYLEFHCTCDRFLQNFILILDILDLWPIIIDLIMYVRLDSYRYIS